MPVAGEYSVRRTRFVGDGSIVEIAKSDPKRAVLLMASPDGLGNWRVGPDRPPTVDDMFRAAFEGFSEISYFKHGDLALVSWSGSGMAGSTLIVIEVTETPFSFIPSSIGE